MTGNDIETIKIMAEKKSMKSVEIAPPHIKAILKKYPAMAKAARYGVDIGLLLDNLQSSVSQRIRRHQTALNAMNRLRNARPL
jgi:imidazolonepropionase-like amidohydrolase